MTLPFTPHASLVEARARLQLEVERVLSDLADGVLPDAAERAQVDCKEEAGRRGAGGVLLPAEPQNLAAAEHLAGEVACFANTPGGGALILGVEDRTGALLGTGLNVDWLRHRIYQRVDVAPAIEERTVEGVRLLVLFVAESREPVEAPDGKLRWRTGGTCQPIDRAEWWLHRQDTAGLDPMAAATDRTLDDVLPGAIVTARRYLRAQQDGEVLAADESPRGLLSRIGALRPDGRLTQAGALTFCASDRTWLSMIVLDVEGGDVLAAAPDLSGRSLIEQVAAIEDRLDARNTAITVRDGFGEEAIRRLPARAVREAVLNGVIHREWMSSEPLTLVWSEEDSALQVVSPGGFVGGISSDNLLTQRYARSPALADLFLALKLVDKGGLGVDRMTREMVTLGHRRPAITEIEGPYVRTRLVGGQPVVPVLNLMNRIQPAVRRRDVRVALITSTLLHRPFVTARSLVPVLQRSQAECAEALDAAAECRVSGDALVRQYKDVWMLSDAALEIVDTAQSRPLLKRRGLLDYRHPDDPASVARKWFADHDRITTGDQATMTGLTQAGALKQLERLTVDGLLRRGEGAGRNAHFTATAELVGAVRASGRHAAPAVEG